MLKDVIDFVMSRTGYTDRTIALREINYAWREIWMADDLPNSVMEMSVQPYDQTARITLPHFVAEIRGVKINAGRIRIDLFGPRPYYQDDTYYQSPYIWRVLGSHPLSTSVISAMPLTFTIEKAENSTFKVCIQGTSDYASNDFEEIVFQPGDTGHTSSKSWSDVNSIVKDSLLSSNVTITGQNGEDFGYIANDEYEARNTVIQITDKCFAICNQCRCFDVLFKKVCPILHNELSAVPFEDVLMSKTLEWILLPKEGGEIKAQMYGEKAKGLLAEHHGNSISMERRLDMGRDKFTTRYYGYL
jgi:hypothetical protein